VQWRQNYVFVPPLFGPNFRENLIMESKNVQFNVVLEYSIYHVYQNQKIRPVVYPFAKQPWVANGQTGRKKGQGEIEKPPFIFGEYTTKNNYPSARWQTESQSCYRVINFDNTPAKKY
jgi:hypothetical protein